MNTIREQLEPLIRDLGLRETARRSGISQSTLSLWLSKKRNVRIGDEQLVRLVESLGLTLSLTND